MAVRTIKKVIKAFPFVVLALLASIAVIYDQYKVLGMFFLLIFLGFSLRFFKFKRVLVNTVMKLLFLIIIYIFLRSVFLSGINETAVYSISGIAIMFFGHRSYQLVTSKNVFASSFATLVLSIILFSIYRNASYDKMLLDILVPLIISTNIVFIYFINNDDEMLHISRHEHKAKTKLVRANRLMVVITLIIAGIAAFFEQIVSFIENVAQATLKGIGWLILMFIALLGSGLTGSEGEGGGGEGGFDLPFEDEAEPSIIWLILEYVMYVIAAAILLILLFFLFKKLYVLLKKLFSYLMNLTSREKARSQTGYEDIVEAESIINVTGRMLKNTLDKLIMGNLERYRPKNIREEIRYQYKLRVRKLKKKGFSYIPAYTADDVFAEQHKAVEDKDKIIKQEFVSLYNLARYSDEEIDPKNIKI